MTEVKLHGTHDDVSFLVAELGKLKGFALELEERNERHFRIRVVASNSFEDTLAKLICFVVRCFSNEKGFVVIKLGDFYVEGNRNMLNILNRYWSFKFVKNWQSIRVEFYDDEFKDVNYVKKEIKKKIKLINKEAI